MLPAGLAAIEEAKRRGTWTLLDDVEDLVVPDDLAAAFDADPPARANWDAFSRSAPAALLEWIVQAEATRDPREAHRGDRRARAARNERANEWVPPDQRQRLRSLSRISNSSSRSIARIARSPRVISATAAASRTRSAHASRSIASPGSKVSQRTCLVMPTPWSMPRGSRIAQPCSNPRWTWIGSARDVGEVDRLAATGDRQVVADEVPAGADTLDDLRERRPDDVAQLVRDALERGRRDGEDGLGRQRIRIDRVWHGRPMMPAATGAEGGGKGARVCGLLQLTAERRPCTVRT